MIFGNCMCFYTWMATLSQAVPLSSSHWIVWFVRKNIWFLHYELELRSRKFNKYNLGHLKKKYEQLQLLVYKTSRLFQQSLYKTSFLWGISDCVKTKVSDGGITVISSPITLQTKWKQHETYSLQHLGTFKQFVSINSHELSSIVEFQ